MVSSVISNSFVPEEEVFPLLPDGLFRVAGPFLFALSLPEDFLVEDDEPDPLGFIIKRYWKVGELLYCNSAEKVYWFKKRKRTNINHGK